MKKSALLEFNSSEFAIQPGEDENTNPGIFGKALAQWLVEQLRACNVVVGDAFGEDFGWCIPVVSKPHSLYVICRNIGEEPGHWGVATFAEGGFVSRLLCTDQREQVVASLYVTLKEILQATPHVQELRETAT